MSDQIENPFGEPLFLPITFEHPRAGSFKDKPEEFFRNLAVRVLSEVDVGGAPMLVPIWLDCIGFFDDVVNGRPCRMGRGRVQKSLTGVDAPICEGLVVPFHPEEVIDTIERFVPVDGGVYMPLAEAPAA